MTTPSRWAQWVIAESATPRVPLPWTLRRGPRRTLRTPNPEFA